MATEKRALTLIAGPARSGKTAYLVSLALAAARDGKGFLFILPAESSAEAIRRRLLAQLSAVETEATATWGSLARRILAAEDSCIREASRYQREILLREAAGELTAAGRLAHFEDMLGFPGFYSGLDTLFRELAACRVSPEAFGAHALNGSPRDEELALLYARYDDALLARGLCGPGGLLRHAQAALETPSHREHAFGAVLVDGFSSFSANELFLLETVTRHAGSAAVTLALEADLRGALFAVPRDAIESLKEHFTVRFQNLPAPSGENPASRVARLFMSANPAEQATGPSGLKVISTAGARMEVEEIAREAKRLLSKGRRPGEIAVGVRDWRTYGALAEEVFGRMGVPLDRDRSTSPAASPLFGLCWKVVEVLESGFARDAVLTLLSSSYVDLPRLAGGVLTAADTARIVRNAGIIKGVQQWRGRLRALGRSLEADDERGRPLVWVDDNGEERTLPPLDATRLQFVLLSFNYVAERISALAADCAPAIMAERFREILEDLGARRRILEADVPEEVLFRDLAAFAALAEAFEFITNAGGPSPEVDARSFLGLLGTLVASSGASSGELSASGVRLVDAATLADLSFPIVFLCGASSDAYPRQTPLVPFHNRDERRRLAEAGLVGETDEMHLAAERLLFYRVATRAEETLYVTYPATDEGGRPRLASFYLDELLRLFSLAEGDRLEYGPSRITTVSGDAASVREAGIAAGSAIRDAAKSADVLEVAREAAEVDDAFEHALLGAAVEARRESLVGFDRFDAALSPKAAAGVARRFPPTRPWSPTALTEYGQCPFSFFLSRVLSVERPEPPGAVPTPLERGNLAHTALALFFTGLRDRDMLSLLYSGDTAPLDEVMEEALEEACRLHEARLGLGEDPFWRIEKRTLAGMVRRFLADEIERLSKPDKEAGLYVPSFFELAFGYGGAGADDTAADAWSSERPVVVEAESRSERLSGRIDRVDVLLGPMVEKEEGTKPEETRTRAVVIDYKLSRAPAAGSGEEFVDMQMPAYLYAAPEVVPGGEKILPAGGLYRTIRTPSGKKLRFPFPDGDAYGEFRKAFAKALFARADLIRSGRFSPTPSGACGDYCIGRGVCRYSRVRLEHLEGADE